MPPPQTLLKLRPLTVGPIVGETTAARCRIWGRGEVNIVDGQPRRCFGALRARTPGGNWGKPLFFKMNPNFDMTGVAVLGGLQARTRYDFEVGYYFSDAELYDARAFDLDWTGASRGSLTTASAAVTDPRTMVVGSCRYLLKTFMGDFYDDRGDKTFRSVLRQIESGRGVDQLLMIGDQIYADDLNALSPTRTVAQFYERYRDAFGQPYVRELMARVPTYMTLDDHEIEDNWPVRATTEDWQTLFPNAIHAFQAYQLSHSPNIPIVGGRLEGTPKNLWYDYADGCTEVFVTDSRTERLLSDDGTRRMLGAAQVSALKRWLRQPTGRVKLVVTSVPFLPDAVDDEKGDKWSGFVEQRAEILEHIDKNKVGPVVFLSGDVHASMLAQVDFPSGLSAWSVVSSAFFWPYPHPSARKFQAKGSVDGGKAGSCSYRLLSPVISDDNFTRLTVKPQGLDWEVFERKGDSLATAAVQWAITSIGN